MLGHSKSELCGQKRLVAKLKSGAYGEGRFKICNPGYSQYDGRRECFRKSGRQELTIQQQRQSRSDGARMRVKIAHSRSKHEAKHAVERSIEQVFAGFNLGPIEFIDQWKHWSGDTMTFSLTAKLGFLQTPILGLAIVTDQEVALEVDLGLIQRRSKQVITYELHTGAGRWADAQPVQPKRVATGDPVFRVKREKIL